MENKQEILDLLLKAMQATRDMYDLVRLEYVEVNTLPDNDMSFVIAEFAQGGKRTINVTADSGIAMIRDVLRQIDG